MKKSDNIKRWYEKKSKILEKYTQKSLLELLAEGKISSPKTVRFTRRGGWCEK